MAKTKSAVKTRKPAEKKNPGIVLNIDPEEFIKAANGRDDALFDEFLGGAGMGDAMAGFGAMMAGFGAMMVVQSLIEQEARILNLEMDKDCPETPNEIRRYVEMRRKAKETLKDKFEEVYQTGRKGHNECARQGLDGSDGNAYYFVLPVFHDDGSHEPPGPKDIPWNVKK